MEQNNAAETSRPAGELEQARRELKELVDSIQNRRERELARLVKELKNAEAELAKIRQRQAENLRKTREAQKNPDAKQRADQLKRLAKEPMWRVVQAHPSAVRFPGTGGESLAGVQERAVAAIREWNARLGPKATYMVCSHGDVIKSIIADSLGMHLDMFQRIQVDPCSLSMVRYTPLRPFVLRMNDTGAAMLRTDARGAVHAGAAAGQGGRGEDDAVVGGGAGG